MTESDAVHQAFDQWIQAAIATLQAHKIPQIELFYTQYDDQTGTRLIGKDVRPNYHDFLHFHAEALASMPETQALTDAVLATPEGLEIITITPPVRRPFWFSQAYLSRLLRFYLDDGTLDAVGRAHAKPARGDQAVC